ncbi:MAG: sigma-70 family RNA polymerase sigma factor [Sphingomonas sp.]
MANEVIPHEAAVRAWLLRSRVSQEDADELIQEAYAVLAGLDAVHHIARPDGYFFSVVRNLLLRRLRRAKIVQIEAIAEIETYAADADPSPERQVVGRIDYDRMLGLIAGLPERCRQIVQMRKIEGLSQREIANRLNVTENVVENQTYLGIQSVLRAWRDGETAAELRFTAFGAEGEHRL